MYKNTYPSVLTIAGFDSSGGAGIQADIKTISALGCYATSVLTALPIQNTCGVRHIFPIDEKAVQQQIEVVLDDIFPKAIKVGMIHTAALVEVVVNTLNRYPIPPLIFDPVMVATSGHQLIENTTVNKITEQLFPLASVVTPNLDEAAILAKMPIETVSDMYVAGEKIMQLGCKSVLLKGGHLKGDRISTLYFDPTGRVQLYEFEKYDTRNTHGSGCTLSSAIASYIAQGESTFDAIGLAQEYVQQAIYQGLDVKTGRGNGPLNHFFAPLTAIKHPVTP